jgi:hypothetical protein
VPLAGDKALKLYTTLKLYITLKLYTTSVSNSKWGRQLIKPIIKAAEVKGEEDNRIGKTGAGKKNLNRNYTKPN